MEAGVPGMRKSIAMINPPEMPPTYSPIRRVTALTGFIWKVSGRVSAMSIEAVRPGIAPTTMPSAVPTNRNRRFSHAKRRTKASIIV